MPISATLPPKIRTRVPDRSSMTSSSGDRVPPSSSTHYLQLQDLSSGTVLFSTGANFPDLPFAQASLFPALDAAFRKAGAGGGTAPEGSTFRPHYGRFDVELLESENCWIMLDRYVQGSGWVSDTAEESSGAADATKFIDSEQKDMRAERITLNGDLRRDDDKKADAAELKAEVTAEDDSGNDGLVLTLILSKHAVATRLAAALRNKHGKSVDRAVWQTIFGPPPTDGAADAGGSGGGDISNSRSMKESDLRAARAATSVAEFQRTVGDLVRSVVVSNLKLVVTSLLQKPSEADPDAWNARIARLKTRLAAAAGGKTAGASWSSRGAGSLDASIQAWMGENWVELCVFPSWKKSESTASGASSELRFARESGAMMEEIISVYEPPFLGCG